MMSAPAIHTCISHLFTPAAHTRCAQAQGDLIHPRRGLSRRRDEARTDRSDRPVHARRRHRAEIRPELPEAAVEHRGGADLSPDSNLDSHSPLLTPGVHRFSLAAALWWSSPRKTTTTSTARASASFACRTPTTSPCRCLPSSRCRRVAPSRERRRTPVRVLTHSTTHSPTHPP